MTVPLTDYADLSSQELAAFQAALGAVTSLERVLSWGRSQRPTRGIEEILTQDEYTHDVIMAVDEGRYVVFDTT